MTIVANLCFALALFVAMALPVVRTRLSPHDGELALTTFLMMPPLWVALSIGLSVVVARCGFDGLSRWRGLQYAAVVVASLALVVVTFFSAALWQESPGQIPWILRPLMPWACIVLPGVVALAGLVALNPRLAAGLPSLAWRGPLLAAGIVCLVAAGGALVEAAIDSVRTGATIARADRDALSVREANSVAEVTAMDPVTDFVALLRYSNVYNGPELRGLVARKLASHPALTEALIERIRVGGCDDAMTFLEGGTLPDWQPLARPARDAIVCMAARIRDDMRTEDTLYDDNLDAATRKVLATADRFHFAGVDFVPAVRDFRAAMAAPNRAGLRPRCLATLDRWIAEQGKP